MRRQGRACGAVLVLVVGCGSGHTVSVNVGAGTGGAGGASDAATGGAGGDAGPVSDAGPADVPAADGSAVDGPTTDGNGPPPPPCAGGLCTDFPSAPMFDVGVPTSVTGMFSGNPPVGSGGVCITEPADGTLFPANWQRPRVKFSGAGGKVVQIRMTADNQANALVAYTMSDSWTIPRDIWTVLRAHQVDAPVTVTVWVQGGMASAVQFKTAPVWATGSIVFFAADPRQDGSNVLACYANPAVCAAAGELRGFVPGDESTVSVLQIGQVQQASRRQDTGASAPVVCVGCHAPTPDSGFVSVVDHYAWRSAIAGVAIGSTGTILPTLTLGGLQALLQPGWGRFTFSPSTWATGQRIGVASLGLRDPSTFDFTSAPDQNDSAALAWINLEAPNAHDPKPGDVASWTYTSYAAGAGISSGNALGIIARTGDARGAATPSWSHDGATIAYASTNASISGRLNIETPSPAPGTDPRFSATTQAVNAARMPGVTDVYTVPFGGGLGGTATPLAGASTRTFEEYYPEYSPDDKLIAFARVPAGEVMYTNPDAEIAVVPAAGGDITVLAANRPPACTGRSSPGVNNTWAKWSPGVAASNGVTYYWLVFSSNRAGLPPVLAPDGRSVQMSQIYVAPVVVRGSTVISYPAIYLWNQPTDRVNTTPSWAALDIPPVQ